MPISIDECNDVFYFSTQNNRGFAGISNSTQLSQQDMTNQSDAGFESTNSSTVFRNRPTMNNRPSMDHLYNNSSIYHSHSAMGVNELYRNSATLNRQAINESIENTSSKQNKSVLGNTMNPQISTNDSISDDLQLYDGNSQLINSSNDERQSLSPVEKTRKQLITTKIFKPFQSIRFRKKVGTS